MIETSVLEERVEQNNRLQAAESKAIFGFWVYLMTDCVLFASLFAVYAVLHNNTFGGESGSQLFSLPYVLTETMILLTSSFTSGLGSIAAHRGDVRWRRSGFLSSYFTLVGTHGLHITVGLLWMAVLLVTVARRGLKPGIVRKLTLLSTFWHFLDLIWIFIFTIVYLLGVVQR
jgi:cytochrome o ubiquinol oxidase subunit 3